MVTQKRSNQHFRRGSQKLIWADEERLRDLLEDVGAWSYSCGARYGGAAVERLLTGPWMAFSPLNVTAPKVHITSHISSHFPLPLFPSFLSPFPLHCLLPFDNDTQPSFSNAGVNRLHCSATRQSQCFAKSFSSTSPPRTPGTSNLQWRLGARPPK
jgi:hypothetical protein